MKCFVYKRVAVAYLWYTTVIKMMEIYSKD